MPSKKKMYAVLNPDMYALVKRGWVRGSQIRLPTGRLAYMWGHPLHKHERGWFYTTEALKLTRAEVKAGRMPIIVK